MISAITVSLTPKHQAKVKAAIRVPVRRFLFPPSYSHG